MKTLYELAGNETLQNKMEKKNLKLDFFFF